MVNVAKNISSEDETSFDWDAFYELCDSTDIPPDFLSVSELNRWSYSANPLAGWVE